MSTTTDDMPDASFVTASFVATRRELFDDTILLGTAEIARQICRRADRALSVLAVTPQRVRRIDGWRDPAGLVTHAAGVDERDRVSGSVCRASGTPRLIEAIIGALVGPLPASAASAPLCDVEVARWSPDHLPGSWAVVGSTSEGRQLVLAATDGLVGGFVDRLDAPADLAPVEPGAVGGLLAALFPPPSPTVAEMLAG